MKRRRGGQAARLGLALLALGTGGCTVPISRGPISDFMFKDYDLPPYRADEAAIGRKLHERLHVSAAVGGPTGAAAAGRVKAWGATSAAALGGPGGSVAGSVLSRIERQPPLPETYSGLFLALPIIATDPNKGPTIGLLPVGVVQEGARISTIFAPDVTYNAIDGLGASFRMRRYFSSDSQLSVDVSGASEGAFDNEVIYSQRRVGPRQFLFFRGQVAYKTDLSTRFYGIGNDTDEDDESSYTFRRSIAAASLGLQLPLHFTAELQERLASYKVGPGSLDDIPSSRMQFPDVVGMQDRFNVLTHRIRLTFDTRDSRTAPTKGIFAEFNYDIADETLGSAVGFHRFSASCTILIPKLRKRFTTAVRAGIVILEGDDVPFYELSTIGGKLTHRGYGDGRFVDDNAWFFSVEERWNAFEYELADVRQIVQLAGFVDLGRVFSENEGFELDHAKVAVGGAVRLVIPESELVTSIDVGFSDEGPAAFVGLDYPF